MIENISSPFPTMFSILLKTKIIKQKILDSSKCKEFAVNNFKFDENGRKFSKRVEITVWENKQFLLFPQYFQKSCSATVLTDKKTRLVWERVNELLDDKF